MCNTREENAAELAADAARLENRPAKMAALRQRAAHVRACTDRAELAALMRDAVGLGAVDLEEDDGSATLEEARAALLVCIDISAETAQA